jgi:type I restriction enzyme S subunit
MNNYQLSIKNYPFYKDSGVEWLGDVPEHWEVRRLKDLTKILTCGLASTPEYVSEEIGVPFLSAQNVRPNRLDLSKYNHISQELHKQLTRYRKPQRNDVLVTRVGAGIGDACIVDTDLEFSVYVSLTHIRTNNKLIPSFIVYFFGTTYLSILNKSGTPDGGGQGNLNVKNVNRFLIPTPPISEQKSIATYLDTKTAQCDRKIDLLTQKATQYGKLKQSLINETVTRGLDKSVPMKDSAIDEIPKHWGKSRLKDICTYTKGYAFKSDDFIDSGTPIVKATDIKQYRILESTSFIDLSRIESYKNVLLKDNDIVISTVGSQPNIIDSAVGQLARIDKRIEGSLLNQNTVILRINQKGIDNKFLYYNLISKSFRQHLDIIARGTANQSSIKISETLEYCLSLPPLSEQKAIADYLDKKTAQIDQIIQTINTQIEKLKELRKTLINDVVTGKIRV